MNPNKLYGIMAGAGCIAAVIYILVDLIRRDDEDESFTRTGKASFYGEAYRGKRMADGFRFNPDRYTCASNTWPLGTWLHVEHDGKSVEVLVTDHGPDITLGRIIDLSEAAFARIADTKRGVVTVRVTPCRTVVPPPVRLGVAHE